MNRVIVKFLSVILFVLITNNVFADFSQKQIRYLSYFDIIKKFQKLEISADQCKQFIQSNSVVYGYASPLTGAPLSGEPNFDFINSFLSCLKSSTLDKKISKILSEEVKNQLGDLDEEIKDKDENHFAAAIDELTLHLIGPEVVLISYGYVKNQKEFRDFIHKSVIKILEKQEDPDGWKYLTNAFILIHLRDEFLSY